MYPRWTLPVTTSVKYHNDWQLKTIKILGGNNKYVTKYDDTLCTSKQQLMNTNIRHHGNSRVQPCRWRYKVVQIWPGLIFFFLTIITKHLLAHVSLQRTPLRSQHNFSNVLEASWCPFQKRLVVGGVSTPEVWMTASLSANRMPCKSDFSLPNR